MTLWFGTGADFNLLTRVPPGNITLSPDAADASYPLAGLKDGRTGVETRHAAISANELVQVDANVLVNPSFETGLQAPWTKVGAGAVAQEGTIKHLSTGSFSFKIDATAGTTYLSQVVTAVPGESWFMAVWASSGDSVARAEFYVYNRQTGKYWTGSVWTSTRTAWATSVNTIYTQLGGSLTIEDMNTCGNLPNVEIEMQLQSVTALGSKIVYFDDAEAYPAVNFCGVFGHNLDPLIVPTVESAPPGAVTYNTPGSWTVRATLDPRNRPTMYSASLLAAPILARFWRLLSTGTNSARSGAISYGELALCQLVQALRDFKPPLRVTWAEMQQRDFGSTGAQWVYALSGGPIRTAAIAFDLVGGWPSTQYIQLRDKLFRLSRNGFYPWLIVIRDADPESCFLGRPPDSVTYEAPVLSWTQVNGITIVEDAMPTRVG